MKSIIKSLAVALTMSAAMLPQANAQTQGVTDTEVVVGSNVDLSGIFAAFSASAIEAANQYFKEVNANGGVHGRSIRLVAEDHGYTMPKAVQNINKLVNSDEIFVMFLQLGTPMNLASFPLLERKGIPNVSPLSAARQMVEPPAPYKYAAFSSYYDQLGAGIEFLKDNAGSSVVCAMYIPNDFGKEVQEGAKEAAERLGLEYGEETTHKGDEQEFTGALTKLREAGCDTIATALGIRQTITALGTAKKLGWDDVKFIGSSAAFHTAVARVPGGVTDGFYAAAGWPDLNTRMDDPYVQQWAASFKEEFGEDPGTGAVLGRSAAEGLVLALEAAGPDLTQESFRAAMENLSYTDRITGVSVDYGKDDHQGADAIIISRIEGGDWQVVGEE
ncbi:MAG: ABC transporter substrate-binding protein [Pseudomonadota bacterium]